MPNARVAIDSSELGESISRDMRLLADDDDVPGLDEEVRPFLAPDRILVLEFFGALLASGIAVNHRDVSLVGEFGEALRAAEHVEHRRLTLDLVGAGHPDPALDGDLEAVDFENDDRHFGRRFDELGVTLGEL